MKVYTCGIYLFMCHPVGQVYVGASVNVESRISGHLSGLRLNKHINPKFQGLYETHGESSFSVLILESCEPNKDDLLQREQKWIDAFGDCLINQQKQARNAGPVDPVKLEERRRRNEEFSKQWELQWQIESAKQEAKKRSADIKKVLSAFKKNGYTKDQIITAVNEVYL